MGSKVVGARTLVIALVAGLFVFGLVPAGSAAEPGPPQPVISTGAFSTCAIRENQRVYCWGRNESGDLGRGVFGGSPAPAPVANGLVAYAVTNGDSTNCALTIDRKVMCWGSGQFGRLGNGATSNSNTPVPVSGLSNVASVDAGFGQSCASKQDGTVWCWGPGTDAQFPGSPSGTHATPVKISGLTSVIQVSVGEDVACALRVDRSVWCWGENSEGNGGAPIGPHAATKIAGITDATQISVGMDVTCATRATGGAACWGRNQFGGLGALTTEFNSLVPRQVWKLTGAKEVSVGAYSACARTATSVKCWGHDVYGTIGDQTFNITNAPVTSNAAITPATSITVGTYATCEGTEYGSVWCWGYNQDGEVGDGTINSAYSGTGPGDAFGRIADRDVIPLLNRPPGKPAGTSTTLRKIKITWTAPSTSNGTSAPKDYAIQYRLKGSTTWRTFADTVTATRSATVTGLTSGKYYQFRVLPKNWAGTGASSLTSSYIKSR
jgi:alpha-tubulin suppressor-like RCC1 family protein